MPDIDEYFDEIDNARSRRAKELSEIKFRFTQPNPDPLRINSQAAVVLTYASWEGFYNECANSYIRFLRAFGRKVRDTDWMLLLGALKSDLNSLRDKNHSDEARQDFVKNLQIRIECGFSEIEPDVVAARSNLNFARLASNFRLLSFDLAPFQRFRLRIDRELVQWRHGVAHGNPPDLTAVSITDHVDFAAELLLVLADGFQNEMVRRV